ncbi:MAG: hypothetical protein QM736_13915 [Vicinamibacterales bacterium]
MRGSVVRSWLLELTARALASNPTLAGLEGYVDDSGEGRWTLQEAIERRDTDAGADRGALHALPLARGQPVRRTHARRTPQSVRGPCGETGDAGRGTS